MESDDDEFEMVLTSGIPCWFDAPFACALNSEMR
jgi:hypothetical protein